MTIDFFLFCIIATLITFSVICIFAAANPGYPKRSYGAENWGGYGKSYTLKDNLISSSNSKVSTLNEDSKLSSINS